MLESKLGTNNRRLRDCFVRISDLFLSLIATSALGQVCTSQSDSPYRSAVSVGDGDLKRYDRVLVSPVDVSLAFRVCVAQMMAHIRAELAAAGQDVPPKAWKTVKSLFEFVKDFTPKRSERKRKEPEEFKHPPALIEAVRPEAPGDVFARVEDCLTIAHVYLVRALQLCDKSTESSVNMAGVHNTLRSYFRHFDQAPDADRVRCALRSVSQAVPGVFIVVGEGNRRPWHVQWTLTEVDAPNCATASVRFFEWLDTTREFVATLSGHPSSLPEGVLEAHPTTTSPISPRSRPIPDLFGPGAPSSLNVDSERPEAASLALFLDEHSPPGNGDD